MRITSCDNSEVFQEYLRIAKASGLIQEIEPTELEKKTKEQDKEQKKGYSTRAEYQEIDTSDLFYGKKPESIYKYKDNIMEAAHDKGPQVAPAYDKQNGIVETNIEQQKIIIDKVNTNYHDHMKNYIKAENDLLKELIKIANVLDLNDNKLVATADKCIEQLNSNSKKKVDKLIKTAVWWLPPIIVAWPWLSGTIATGGLAGLIGYLSNKPPMDDGVIKNINYVIEELSDITQDKWYSFTGKEQGAGIEGNVQEIVGLLKNLEASANEYVNVYPTANANNLDKSQLKHIAETIQQFVTTAKSSIESLQSFLKVLLAQKEKHKNRETGTGWYNKTYRSLKGLFADDFSEVEKGILVLINSLQAEISKHNQAAKAVEQSQPKTQQKRLNTEKLEKFIKDYIAEHDEYLNPKNKQDLLEKCKVDFVNKYNSGEIKSKAQAHNFIEQYVLKYVKELGNVAGKTEQDLFD